jgi:hypothetical protein
MQFELKKAPIEVELLGYFLKVFFILQLVFGWQWRFLHQFL